jgi:hypothetical protein
MSAAIRSFSLSSGGDGREREMSGGKVENVSGLEKNREIYGENILDEEESGEIPTLTSSIFSSFHSLSEAALNLNLCFDECMTNSKFTFLSFLTLFLLTITSSPSL